GSLSGTASGTLDGTLDLTKASSTYSGGMSGSGGLTVSGGTETLSGKQTYTGETLVQSGGTLQFYGNDSGTSSVIVGNKGSVSGNGSVGDGNSDVEIQSGGTIYPGQKNRTNLTISGNLITDSGSTQNFTGESGNGSGKNSEGTISVDKNLSLDGTIVANNLSSSYGSGVERLYDYGGTLEKDTASLVLNGTPVTASDYIQDSNHQVNIVLQNGPDTLSFWDGANTSVNSQVDGGTGTWQQTGGASNWTNATGNSNAGWTANDFAIFEQQGSKVSVDGNVDVSGMQFDENGGKDSSGNSYYSLVPNGNTSSITLNGTNYSNNTSSFDVVSSENNDPQVSGKLTNQSGLASVIRVGNGTGSGDSDLAVIQTNINDSSEKPTTLVKTDSGTLVLSGENSYNGGTVVTDGVLEITTDKSLGTGGTAVEIDGGTLKIGEDVQNSARQIIFGSNNATIDLDGHEYTPGAAMVGPGSVLIDSSQNTAVTTTEAAAGVPSNGDASVLNLNYDNTYTGNTTIIGLNGDPSKSDPTVTVEANTENPFGDSTISAVGGNVTLANGAVVNMNGPSTDGSAAVSSMGYHSVDVQGSEINFNNKSTADHSNITTQTGYWNGWGSANTPSTINFNDSSTAGNSTINNGSGSNVNFTDYSDAGSSTVNNSGNVSFSGMSNASSATVKNLSNAQVDISGMTQDGVSIGSLSGAGTVVLGSKDLSVGALDKNDTISGVIEDGHAGSGGSVTKVGTGTTTLTGTDTYTGATTIDNGTLALSGTGSIAQSTGVQDNAAFDISGVTTGSSSIQSLNGAGTVALGGNTLDITNGNATFGNTFSGVASGSGGLTVSGGTETLSGANTYTGVTTVASGAGLSLPGSVAGALTTAGTTDVNGGTVAGTTTNTGTLTAEGGTLA
ncbi:beta strand repeat-containing protein, partial [Komagataeibacter oboediens]